MILKKRNISQKALYTSANRQVSPRSTDRIRPQQMSQIGTTPIPTLDGDNFGNAVFMDVVAGGAGGLYNDCKKKRHIKQVTMKEQS